MTTLEQGVRDLATILRCAGDDLDRLADNIDSLTMEEVTVALGRIADVSTAAGRSVETRMDQEAA